MKKTSRILALSLVLILALSLCGCGSSARYEAAAAEAPAAAPMPMPEVNGYYAADTAEAEEMGYGYSSGIAAAGTKLPEGEALITPSLAEKIIYSANAELETTEFDKTVEDVYALVAELGGFMESTSMSGNNYYSISRGYNGGRCASFTIRIPSESFAGFTNTLSTLGNVPWCNTYSENITRQYYDVQSRLDAYEVQRDRLLEMLAIAETVEDMLAIQRELTDVQYEIDSLTSTLNNYDNSVNYSTVNLSVTEVQEYTPEPTAKLSYGEKMVRGFRDSLKDVGDFFTGLLLWLVSHLPAILAIVLALVILFVLLRRAVKNRDARRAKRRAKREAKKAKRAAEKAPEDAEDK